MLSIKETSSNSRAIAALKRIKQDSNNSIRKGFFAFGKDLISTSKQLIMETPKHGRTYLIRLKGKLHKHIASAPYEAPANLTGALKKSIDFEVSGEKTMSFGSKDESTLNGVSYGRVLELGVESRNLEPRPYLYPSIIANQKNAIIDFEFQLKESLSK